MTKKRAPEPESQKFDLATYRRILDDSTAWLQAGTRLLQSADLLWVELERAVLQTKVVFDAAATTLIPGQRLDADLPATGIHAPAFLLLCACAIENVLKAVLVKRTVQAGESVTDENGRLNARLPKDRNLVRLGILVFGDTQVSVTERITLSRLTQMLRWAGRYPMDSVLPHHVDAMRAGLWGSGDRDTIRTLAARIIAKHDDMH